ncbi:MAG TPA: sugar transferase [Caldisericia bacterium]|nr:sugar transferase [Caldisericia bacterium]HNY61829.1 sugar transferase [Caldisericia bacterium]HOC79644.1 sugar transferase [Caldisericia bacterium]HOG70935.1 sugar transferase [Caldisericia bacterium]HPA66286.1 sugar transferase [Caldisericia bacterium]
MKIINPAWKRIEDLVLGVLGTIVLSPLLLFISLAIVIDDGFPVFFIQKRMGQGEKPFNCVKFRTMVKNAANIGTGIYTAKDDPRITKVGKHLRSFLDELPQIFNVIQGSMSIVGPRPSMIYQAKRYNEEQKKRLLVKPGITGWAQVNGRNNISWPKKIELDCWYADHVTFATDMKIIFMTFSTIAKPNTVYSDAEPDDPISRLDGVANPDALEECK